MNDKEIFEKNEIEANKIMTFISAIMAFVLFAFWLLIMFGVNAFSFTPSTIRYVKISCPIDIVLMIAPLLIRLLRPNSLKKDGFKYFVITLLILAVASVNMVLPKDGVMLWATVIVIAALYFDPRVTIYVFIFTSIIMFVVTPLSTIYGAWESNVMCTTEEEFIHYFRSDGITPLNPDSRLDRIYWLNNFNEITGKTEINRWIAMFIFYFFPRFIIFSVIFLLANILSKRTGHILKEEADEARSMQKMISELNIASSIQSSCLPNEFPNTNRCELFAIMDPAKEVGGDFYDFFKIDEDHLVLVIGDVSGKGIPASLFMMKTQAVINALADSIKDNPSLIFEMVNDAVCKGNDMNMFVTCWIGIINLSNGELHYTSAGHNPPVIKYNGEYSYLKGKGGFVLGGKNGTQYYNNKITLEKGDKLFIYTDGVTEAHDINKNLYGEERLLDFFKKEDPSPNVGIVKLRQSIKDFANGAEQFDDITMLMFEYHKN